MKLLLFVRARLTDWKIDPLVTHIPRSQQSVLGPPMGQ